VLALERWARGRLPRIPQGDIAAVLGPATRAAVRAGAILQRADAALRTWSAAALALVVMAVLLGYAIGVR
jgi:hypothetical protein